MPFPQIQNEFVLFYNPTNFLELRANYAASIEVYI
jgi:hypothetical protein